jgi:hypothetical protein
MRPLLLRTEAGHVAAVRQPGWYAADGLVRMVYHGLCN